MEQKNLSALFNKFVGQRIKNPNRLTCDIDPVMYEMEGVARQNGLDLRVILPGEHSDRTPRPDRVTVYAADQQANGSFRIDRVKLG